MEGGRKESMNTKTRKMEDERERERKIKKVRERENTCLLIPTTKFCQKTCLASSNLCIREREKKIERGGWKNVEYLMA